MKFSLAIPIVTAVLFGAGQAFAVPTLQIGAPAGTGDTGIYADYQGSTTSPTEEDTAITSGNIIYVAGAYGPNTVHLGGQYTSTTPPITGDNWSDFGFPASPFNTHNGILLVSVPEGELATALASLTVNGNLAFYSDATTNFFPNNHAPVQSGVADFLFFDIGNFSNSGSVPDFDSETGSAAGEIKTLTIGGFGSLDWVHFDAMAIETDQTGGRRLRTTFDLVNNPGSHDVTWKDGSGPPIDLPEPGIIFLLGAGLAGLGFSRSRK